MKRVLFLVIALLCAAPLLDAQTGVDDPIGIIIGEGGYVGGNPAHYAPALIPLQAAYYPSLSTIMVYFRFDLGMVSVEIENLNTGEYGLTAINATQGVHPFVISGDDGSWSITFSLSNGNVYYGEFDIE